MCTATFIKDKSNRLIFTTNRDEHAARPTSPPEIHNVNGLKILFPQDQVAGGTWVGLSENALLCCLMNGAEGEYQWLGKEAGKSRGQVLLDAFQYNSADTFMEESDFEKVHPFTLLYINTRLEVMHAVKWNGSKKWMEEFDMSDPHIWSAYTLYPEEQRKKRSARFHQWVHGKKQLNAEDMMEMHLDTEEKNGLLLEGNDSVNTISVTQLVIDESQCSMTYREVGKEEIVQKELVFD